jgi:membrane protein
VSPEIIDRTRTNLERRWRAAGQRHHSLEHVVDAWVRFRDNHGNHYAAAITYFSFLALFPLVLLAVSVLGFVLRHNPDLLRTLLDNLTENVPGPFGSTLQDSINAAIRARTGVGLLALGGLLLTGLGWIGNLRAAIHAMWDTTPPAKNFFRTKIANLVVLAGLGLATIVSIGLTSAGTAFTDVIVRALGLDDVPGVPTLLKIFGILLAVAGDTLIFAWLLIWLPGVELPARLVVQGGLLAAVGFEVLKIVGTYYIARVTQSPAVGIFGSVIGLLVWIYLVSRYVLYCAAWMATATGGQASTATSAEPEPESGDAAPAISDEPPQWTPSPLRIVAAVFGAGVAAGAAAVSWLRLRRPPRG